MAVMIPEKPDFIFKESKEDIIFKALEEKLSDDYYVLYSFKITNIVKNIIYDSESDFIVIHPNKGILCIEAKAAYGISYDSANDSWFYADTAGAPRLEMKNPFAQAQNICHNLYNEIRDKFGFDKVYKVVYGVWFPCMSKAQLDRLKLPLYANKELILTEEALDAPEKYLDSLFKFKLGRRYSNEIFLNDAYKILNDIKMDYLKKRRVKFHLDAYMGSGLVMAIDGLDNPDIYLSGQRAANGYEDDETLKVDMEPSLYNGIIKMLLPESKSVEVFDCCRQVREAANRRFVRLCKEQAAVLDFLEGQTVVAVNGAAGTGKTLVAAEKARQLAERGEKVLFLCFNRYLKDYLEGNYADKNIKFFTIAGFDCELRKQKRTDAEEFCQLLREKYANNPEAFAYDHIIIDEGQDFGTHKKAAQINAESGADKGAESQSDDKINKSDYGDAFKILRNIIEKKSCECKSFYVFYDGLQAVQKNKLPDFLINPGCKITLPRNCRNTVNIANAALAALPKPERPALKFKDGDNFGEKPEFYYSVAPEQIVSHINKILQKHKDEHKLEYGSIVILTLKRDREAQDVENSKVSVFSKYCCRTNKNDETGGYDMYYKYDGAKIRFTTCRKFKGLDADAVILIDIDGDTFKGKHNKRNRLLYYVGATRARLYLDVITSMKSKEWKDCMR